MQLTLLQTSVMHQCIFTNLSDVCHYFFKWKKVVLLNTVHLPCCQMPLLIHS